MWADISAYIPYGAWVKVQGGNISFLQKTCMGKGMLIEISIDIPNGSIFSIA
jgi:hypothetical protein